MNTTSGYLFQHEGTTFSPDGIVSSMTSGDVDSHNKAQSKAEIAWIRETKPEVFVCYYERDESHRGLGFVTTWIGEKIAAATVVSSWRDRHHNRMLSIIAKIDGVLYHGRGQGNGMSVVLRKSRKQ